MKCDINHIHKEDETFSTIEKYLINTSSDNKYQTWKIEEAYEIKRHGEHDKFIDHGNKKLLWHGSRITNFVGILSQGLSQKVMMFSIIGITRCKK